MCIRDRLMSVGKCLVGKCQIGICHQARESSFLPSLLWMDGRNETEKIKAWLFSLIFVQSGTKTPINGVRKSSPPAAQGPSRMDSTIWVDSYGQPLSVPHIGHKSKPPIVLVHTDHPIINKRFGVKSILEFIQRFARYRIGALILIGRPCSKLV